MRRLAALVALVCSALTALAADFTGTYEYTEDGEKGTLRLKQSGDQLTGDGEAESMKLKVTGKVTGNTATGKVTMTMEGMNLPADFRAKLEGDKLTFMVAGDEGFADAEEYVFTRKGATTAPTEPPAGGGAGEQPPKGQGGGEVPPGTEGGGQFSKRPSDILSNGKEYAHSSGGKFRLPRGWRVEEGEGYLQLVPPNPAQGETILITSESAQGATDPASPEVLSYMESQVTESMPDARRTGQPERTASGAGKGVIVSWKGTAEGRQVTVRGYVTIVKDNGVALIAVGSEEQVQRRDADLRAIFGTIGWGQGKADQQLVGTWNHWSYKGSSNNSYSRETKVQVVLNADGSFTYSNNTETASSGDGGSMTGRSGSGWGGRWTASNGTLILHFEDGSTEEVTYRFERQGENTFLVTESPGGGNKMEWSRG